MRRVHYRRHREFNWTWIAVPIIVTIWIVLGAMYINQYQTCDGIVKEDALGIPRCFAEGGTK